MKPILFSMALAAFAAPCMADPATPTGDSGAYLAGRQAAADNRFDEAAELYQRALSADPDELELRQALAFFLAVGGDLSDAAEQARLLEEADQSSPHSTLAEMVWNAKNGEWARVVESIEAGQQTSPAVDRLALAWALVGMGEMSRALTAFDAAMTEEGLSSHARQHKAMALALAGDFESAEELLADPEAQIAGSEIAIRARVELLSLLDRPNDAKALIAQHFGTPPRDPAAARLLARLDAGEPLTFTQITSAQEGLGAALLLVGYAHGANENYGHALLHARLSSALWEGAPAPLLASAEALIALGRPDLAAEALKQIPEDSAARFQADMARARALDAAGDTEAAIPVLDALAQTYPRQPETWSALADMNRRVKRFDAALDAYDRALALTERGAPAEWVLNYGRGIVLNDMGRWTEARKSFEAALESRPNQPNVLNFLGYSMVERGDDLPLALELIERAVDHAPNNGAIVDSLAWALFRSGRVEEAVPHMERAAELEPTDPVVIDHLGDVLWTVGRRYEAKFEWRRALSFGPEPADAERIREKLDRGLTDATTE